MKNKKLWISTTFLGLTLMAASAVILLGKPFEAYAGKPFFNGETGTYRYTGKGLDSGDVLVDVHFDIDDPEALRAYREANAERAKALIQQGEPQLIWVQITFHRPLPTAEVQALVKETGFRVDNFEMVGRSADGRHRLSRTRVGDIEDDAAHMVVPLWGVDTMLAGVILLQGEVETTEQGLGRWLADNRVYMIDTTGVEVRELVARRHADVVADRDIFVSLTSPFWRFDW